jgi:hypothetical protein
VIEAVGDAPPRYLLHDRDSIYDARFRVRLRGLGVKCPLSPPRAPLATRFASASWGQARPGTPSHIPRADCKPGARRPSPPIRRPIRGPPSSMTDSEFLRRTRAQVLAGGSPSFAS